MYDRTYLVVKRLYAEIHRVKYNHADESLIFDKTLEIINNLKQLEAILKQKIEE